MHALAWAPGEVLAFCGRGSQAYIKTISESWLRELPVSELVTFSPVWSPYFRRLAMGNGKYLYVWNIDYSDAIVADEGRGLTYNNDNIFNNNSGSNNNCYKESNNINSNSSSAVVNNVIHVIGDDDENDDDHEDGSVAGGGAVTSPSAAAAAAAAASETCITRREWRKRKERREQERQATTMVSCLKVSCFSLYCNDRHIALGFYDSEFDGIWDTITAELVYRLTSHCDTYEIMWNSDGTHLASTGVHGLVYVWDFTLYGPEFSFCSGNNHQRKSDINASTHTAAFHMTSIILPTGFVQGALNVVGKVWWRPHHCTHLACQFDRGFMSILDAESGYVIARAPTVGLPSCAWSPDGKMFALLTNELVRVWDADSLIENNKVRLDLMTCLLKRNTNDNKGDKIDREKIGIDFKDDRIWTQD